MKMKWCLVFNGRDNGNLRLGGAGRGVRGLLMNGAINFASRNPENHVGFTINLVRI